MRLLSGLINIVLLCLYYYSLVIGRIERRRHAYDVWCNICLRFGEERLVKLVKLFFHGGDVVSCPHGIWRSEDLTTALPLSYHVIATKYWREEERVVVAVGLKVSHERDGCRGGAGGGGGGG